MAKWIELHTTDATETAVLIDFDKDVDLIGKGLVGGSELRLHDGTVIYVEEEPDKIKEMLT